jgi:light-regulated signal transduction histidine kinase (bacteriophytochrome)/CheY-like chemotaxis protein
LRLEQLLRYQRRATHGDRAIKCSASVSAKPRILDMSERPVQFGEADLTDCDREPIHIPGSIQPHGALLALDPETLTVAMAGGATERFLGLPPAELIGRGLDARLGGLELRRLGDLTVRPTTMPQPTLMFEAGLTGVNVDVSASLSDGLVLLELEDRAPDQGLEGIELVQGMVRRLEAASTFDALTQSVVDEVQAATGFDRVMLYRFQDDDSGHVIAETRRSPEVASFLDLHYPASDIPVQARKLYLSSWIRHIPDARYKASPLTPSENPKTGRPLDLSFCGLRSVSPIHLEYLANMGVVASTSLSLVVAGKLWGLVACHHAEPLYLSARVRAACELFAQLASLQLQNRLEIDLAEARLRTRDIQTKLISKSNRLGLPDGLLGPEPTLTTLIPAAGVAVVADGILESEGLTPDPKVMPDLLNALNGLAHEGVFATDRIAELTGIDPGGGVAGVLALAISREPKDYVLWFLPEQVREVRWAGDPDKPLTSGPHGDRLTPRKSFEAWTQTVRGASRPWRPIEVEAAGLLRVSLLELVLQRVDQLARERSAARAHQDLLMAELDHRVKNSLATIQSMVRFSSRSAEDLVGFVNSIQSRLHSMAKAHNLLTKSRWEGASLRAIIEDELHAHNIPGGCDIGVEGADFDLEPKAALATSMVLHELVTNAIKYGCLSEATGRLHISWRLEEGPSGMRLVLDWLETCGRPIAAPSRKGFGRTLLERIFAQDVDGAVHVEFEATGLRCRLEIPEARVTRRQGAVEVSRAQGSPPTSREGLQRLKVLVVEDNALIAEDLAAWLITSGASVLGPYGTLREGAEAARGAEAIDVALLDVDVDGEPVWSLATHLKSRGVPFVLTTGFSPDIERPSDLAGSPLVNKPYDFGELQATITAATRAIAPREL